VQRTPHWNFACHSSQGSSLIGSWECVCPTGLLRLCCAASVYPSGGVEAGRKAHQSSSFSCVTIDRIWACSCQTSSFVLRLNARSCTRPQRIIILPPKSGTMPPTQPVLEGGKAMVSPLFSYQLAVLALVWLFVLLPVTGAKPSLPAPPMPAKPKRKRSTEPTPFAGLTPRPPCARCERETVHPTPPAPVPPAPMPPTSRRPRTVDTSRPFCPPTDGA
jgi:hypothetical protein